MIRHIVFTGVALAASALAIGFSVGYFVGALSELMK
jgi:hypothetical protein